MAQKPLRLPTSTLPTTTSPSIPPALHDKLIEALVHANSHQQIKETIQDSLAASGWTDNLRAFIHELLRSNEATTYNEVLARVMEEVGMSEKQSGTNGHANGIKPKSIEEGGLKVPENVVKDSIMIVRDEIKKVAEIIVDDE